MKAILMLPLLLLAVITPTLVYSTNESSYNEGFHNGFDGYNCVQTDDCDIVSNDDGQLLCSNQLDDQHVSNSTACIDGYVNGWKHWCSVDIKDCLGDVLYGYFPDVHHMLKSSCQIITYTRNATTGLIDGTLHHECGSYNGYNDTS